MYGCKRGSEGGSESVASMAGGGRKDERGSVRALLTFFLIEKK
jgi:hypothetical protein